MPCGGPAPPPSPGLFTHSPSILRRRHPPLGRLRATATPLRRGHAPRLPSVRVRTLRVEHLSCLPCRCVFAKVMQPQSDTFLGGAVREKSSWSHRSLLEDFIQQRSTSPPVFTQLTWQVLEDSLEFFHSDTSHLLTPQIPLGSSVIVLFIFDYPISAHLPFT